jgi:hypothetical protein
MKTISPASATGSSEEAPGRPHRPRLSWRLAAGVFAVVAILALAYGGYWMVLSSRLEAGVLDWIAERRAEGYDVRYAAIERGGFPRSAHVMITAPAIAAPTKAAPADPQVETLAWAWSATRLVAAVDPFDPRHFSVDVPGAHAISIGEGQARYEAEARQFRVEGEAGRATPAAALRVRELVVRQLPGEGSAPPPISAPMSAPIANPGSGDPSADAMAIARLDATGRSVSRDGPGATISADVIDDIGASYQFILNAGDVVLPRWLELPLGHAVRSVVAEGTVQGPLALAPWPEALLRWRDAGGVLDIAVLEAEYGPLTLAGSGTLALDAAGQPVGAFATRTSGLFGAIDRLHAGGYMSQGEALVAKLALNLLAGTPDRQAPLPLPLTLQDRVLSVGPVALMTLPEIDWLPVANAPASTDLMLNPPTPKALVSGSEKPHP